MSRFNCGKHIKSNDLLDYILNLAKLQEKEPDFQNEEEYISLKANPSYLHPKELPGLIEGLKELGFFQEVEFWYHELMKLDCLDASDRESINCQFVIYHLKFNSNHGNDEKVLKYAHDCQFIGVPDYVKLKLWGKISPVTYIYYKK